MKFQTSSLVCVNWAKPPAAGKQVSLGAVGEFALEHPHQNRSPPGVDQVSAVAIAERAILVVGILIFPVIWLYLTAFKPGSEMFRGPFAILPTEITFANFARIWAAVGFQSAFRNSLLVAAASSLIDPPL